MMGLLAFVFCRGTEREEKQKRTCDAARVRGCACVRCGARSFRQVDPIAAPRAPRATSRSQSPSSNTTIRASKLDLIFSFLNFQKIIWTIHFQSVKGGLINTRYGYIFIVQISRLSALIL